MGHCVELDSLRTGYFVVKSVRVGSSEALYIRPPLKEFGSRALEFSENLEARFVVYCRN